MNLEDVCKKLDINYEDILNRFGGNETLYKKFLNRFLEDQTYQELKKAWNLKIYAEIEKNAHTLKGIAGNLGLGTLFKTSNELVQKIRNKKYEELEETYNEIEKAYYMVKDTIENL